MDLFAHLKKQADEARVLHANGVRTRERIEKEVLIPMLNDCHDPAVSYTGCFEGISLYRKVIETFVEEAPDIDPKVLARTLRSLSKAFLIHADHIDAEGERITTATE